LGTATSRFSLLASLDFWSTRQNNTKKEPQFVLLEISHVFGLMILDAMPAF
jgi:hypothetical protein